jgi:glycosyltransferase involved in cell wall biosynthesis
MQHLRFCFDLVVIGEQYKKVPPAFERAKQSLARHIIQWGFVDSFEDYANWLWEADILPVTSNQDFFGISAVEAMYCNTFPILPNRLAFPEHLPTDVPERKQVYYDSFEQLTQQIKTAIERHNDGYETRVRKYVERYDWQRVTRFYDANFLRLHHAHS